MRTHTSLLLTFFSLFSYISLEAKDSCEHSMLSEKAIYFLEEHIPELAETAIKQAYWQALASGCNVLIARDGFLIEIQPDGTETIIKELPRPTLVIPGQKITKCP